MVRSAYGDTVWAGASREPPALRDWNPSFGSADADMAFDTAEIRARSRDLDRNESLARGYFDTTTVSAIGTGLMPLPRVDWRVLGRDRAWADKTNQLIRSPSRDYYESTDVDASRAGGFGELQGLAFRNVLMSGSVGALMTWRPDDCAKWATCVHLIEADRISNPMGAMDTRLLRGGVEQDAYGKAIAYYVQTQHPGDLFMTGQQFVWQRIEAETSWGRPRFLHVFERERPSQSTGMAFLAAVMPSIKMLSETKRNECAAAATNSIVAMTIKSPASMAELAGMFQSPDAYMQARNGWNGKVRKLASGAVVPLFPGDELQSFTPGRPNPAVIEFIKAISRDVATSVGLPLEVIDHDWSKLNYSSARTVLLDAWRTYTSMRAWFTRRFCGPVHRCWMEEAVLSGAIPDCDYDSFLEHTAAWCRVSWQAPGKGWVDPVKEAQAAGMRVSLGLSTLEEECAEQGRDWADVLEQKAAEKERYESLGLVYPGDQAPVGEKVWEDDGGDEATADGDSSGKGAAAPAKGAQPKSRPTQPAPKPKKKTAPPAKPGARARSRRHAA